MINSINNITIDTDTDSKQALKYKQACTDILFKAEKRNLQFKVNGKVIPNTLFIMQNDTGFIFRTETQKINIFNGETEKSFIYTLSLNDKSYNKDFTDFIDCVKALQNVTNTDDKKETVKIKMLDLIKEKDTEMNRHKKAMISIKNKMIENKSLLWSPNNCENKLSADLLALFDNCTF